MPEPQAAPGVLPAEFFAREVQQVAADLLGRVLVRSQRGRRLAGRIVETEAYGGAEDAASHAARGPTRRNQLMFGPPGHSYVYLIYGMHHCLNIVCGEEGKAAAVLIRALEPLEGEDLIARRRGDIGRLDWLRGPGRLCRALDVDLRLDGVALPDRRLWLEAGEALPPRRLVALPRVNVDYAGEAAAWPWRFCMRDCAFVSAPRPRSPLPETRERVRGA